MKHVFSNSGVVSFSPVLSLMVTSELKGGVKVVENCTVFNYSVLKLGVA